jgi:hypothetical protein
VKVEGEKLGKRWSRSGAGIEGDEGDVEEGCGGEEGEWGEEEQRRGEELKELKVVV